MTSFAAYIAAETPNAFQRAGHWDNPQNLPLHWGISMPIYYMVPWTHPSQPSIDIWIGSAVFARLKNVTNRQAALLRCGLKLRHTVPQNVKGVSLVALAASSGRSFTG